MKRCYNTKTKLERMINAIAEFTGLISQKDQLDNRIREVGKEINKLKEGLTPQELNAIDNLYAVVLRDYPEMKKETTDNKALETSIDDGGGAE